MRQGLLTFRFRCEVCLFHAWFVLKTSLNSGIGSKGVIQKGSQAKAPGAAAAS